MTEEEIRPIAENYVEEYCHCSDGEYTDGSLVCAGIGTALIVSRQLEKRITELEKENKEVHINWLKVIQENAELKEENRQLKNEVEDLNGYCNQIGKVKTDVLKAFEHIVAK